MTAGPWINHFGENFLWSNAILILKGMAPYGVVSLEEMDRAITQLGAKGIQIFTNMNGQAMDDPVYYPIFERMVKK